MSIWESYAGEDVLYRKRDQTDIEMTFAKVLYFVSVFSHLDSFLLQESQKKLDQETERRQKVFEVELKQHEASMLLHMGSLVMTAMSIVCVCIDLMLSLLRESSFKEN